MEKSTQKTQTIVISRDLTRYKLVSDEPIEQVRKFKYWRAEVTSSRNIYDKIRTQAVRANQISGYLKYIIWNNKYLSTKSNIQI